MKIGIVGNGMVGSAMAHLFPEALIWDIDEKKANATKEQINQCDVVFVCVPTDGNNAGYDYQPLEETVRWLKAKIIIIKSTVEPGTTERLAKVTRKNIVFNPEFLREKTRFEDIKNEARVIVGTNDPQTFKKVRDLYYQKYDQDKVDVLMTEPATAELVKVVGNSFLAMKVIFVNEVNQICKMLDVDYESLRRLWLTDGRVGKSHTLVSEQGGFGGYCFPKDLRALVHTAEEKGYNPQLLKEVWNTNCRFRDEFNGQEYQEDKILSYEKN